MLAVALYFRHDLVNLLSSPFRRDEEARLHRRLLGLILAGSVPTALIGLTFKDYFEGMFENIPLIALMLLVTGTLLFVSEKFRHGDRRREAMTLRDALVVGAVQGVAIVPGISRSGSTIAALLLRGIDGETAARFSFLLALPAVCGAALLSLRDVAEVPAGEWPFYLAGTAVAFAAGMLSIHFLLAVIRKRRLFAFALYCWLAGSTVLALTL